jgi:hypothetical protein
VARYFAIIVKDSGSNEEQHATAEDFLNEQDIDLEADCEIETCVELNPCKAGDVVFSVKLEDPEQILPKEY